MQTEHEIDFIIVRIWTLSDKSAVSVFNVQLQAGLALSVFLVCRYFYRRMKEEGGSVWNMLSQQDTQNSTVDLVPKNKVK